MRMATASLGAAPSGTSVEVALDRLWEHPQVLDELREVLAILRDRVARRTAALEFSNIPLQVHARYTRTEILAAFGIGEGAGVPEWREGVRWDEASRSDIFAFTLDKSAGGFSPTTRYRDYAMSPWLIHWESQSATSSQSATGQRYIHHGELGTNVFLFARLTTRDRAFWFLGPATYVRHEGERPVAFVWRLKHHLPPDLFTAFAAAAA